MIHSRTQLLARPQRLEEQAATIARLPLLLPLLPLMETTRMSTAMMITRTRRSVMLMTMRYHDDTRRTMVMMIMVQVMMVTMKAMK